jgi:hypothetical protein
LGRSATEKKKNNEKLKKKIKPRIFYNKTYV